MQIVIDIDESILNDAKNGHVRLGEIADAVLSGTPYEERLQGELNLEYLAKFADKTPSYETVKQLGFAGSYEDYLKTICGADMRGGKQCD